MLFDSLFATYANRAVCPQLIITFVTSDPMRVPEPLLTVQTCAGLTGCDCTVTE